MTTLQTNASSHAEAETFEHRHQDAYVQRQGDLLTIGNARLRRVLDLAHGLPRTVSLESDGVAFAVAGGELPDTAYMGLDTDTGLHPRRFTQPVVTASAVPHSHREADHLRVTLRVEDTLQRVTYVRVYVIHPQLPALGTWTTIQSAVRPNLYWTTRNDLNTDRLPISSRESRVDGLTLANGLRPALAVAFKGRTDYGNDLLQEQDAAGATTLRGNLLICQSASAELLILQEAPPSDERRDLEPYDFRLDGAFVSSCGWGILPHELSPDEPLCSYRHVILACADKAQRPALLKAYLARRFAAGEQASVTVNPWGCTNFRDRVSESFLREEIAAAADLGATHYQIDDGWQAGGPLSSLVIHNQHADAAFWTVCPRTLPHGMTPLTDTAKQAGIQLALWFAPSFNQDYRDWRQQADILLGFYREHGMAMFKLDAIQTRTKAAEDNLAALAGHLRDATDGRAYINFDTTNGQRPGYFLMLEHGNVFLENRYTRGWGVAYHPESTLRNLWRLSHYMRPQSLQIEFADPGLVEAAHYAQRGLTLPTIYPPAYWAAVSLMASPLAWLAPTLLSDDVRDAYRQVIALHHTLRPSLSRGQVHPIGQAPSGQAITGFHLALPDHGYLLLFREHGCAATQATLPLLPGLIRGKAHGQRVHGQAGDALAITADGAQATLPQAATFTLWRYDVAD